MVAVRGSLVLNTFAFLRDLAGPDAHLQVLEGLPQETCDRLRHQVRAASWERLDDLVAYMKVAKQLHGHADPDFYRSMGQFSGRSNRDAGGFDKMLSEPGIAVRMGRLVWRALYDRGRLDVEPVTDRFVMVRIHDFLADPAYCERMCGALEGMLTSESDVAHASETRCAAQGAPYCEYEVRWI